MRHPILTAAILALTAGPAVARSVLSEDQQRAAFAAADTNGDGVVDEAEFAADIVTAFVAHDSDLDEIVIIEHLPGELHRQAAEVDADADGRLTFREVRAFKLCQFEELDANGNHLLEVEEVVMEGPAP